MTAFSLAEMSREMFASRDRLATIAHTHGRAAGLTRLFDRLGRRIARPPRVALVGEFNSGKSTLANALLGTELLPTSIHANTRVPILVHFSPEPQLSYEDLNGLVRPLDMAAAETLRQGNACMLRVGLPVERLKHYELIDTPGLASGSRRLDAMMLEACRRSHIAIWCTVASQAWKASEQAQWAAVPRRLKATSMLAVTHIDAIVSERDRDRLAKRLTIEAKPHFGALCTIAVEEARAARRAGPGGAVDAEGWRDSGGERLEAELLSRLDGLLASRQVAARRLLERTTLRLGAGVATACADTCTDAFGGQFDAAVQHVAA